MASKRDHFLLRLSPGLLDTLKKWADDELRSTNAQIEYLLADAVRRAGRKSERPQPAVPPGTAPPAAKPVPGADQGGCDPEIGDVPVVNRPKAEKPAGNKPAGNKPPANPPRRRDQLGGA